jgi:predicted ATPase/DNA-binding SARP family transcriptional activator
VNLQGWCFVYPDLLRYTKVVYPRVLAKKGESVSRLKLYLLGHPRLEVDGESVRIGRRKAFALLAYLAVERASRGADADVSVHSRDVLATLFWPGYDQSGARGRLRRTLTTLNRALGEGWLMTSRETLGLNPDAAPSAGSEQGLWLDVDQFRRRLAACEEHTHPANQTCPECLERLAEAAELYRDDFMAGFTLPDSLAFDEWQRHQAEKLQDEMARVLERLGASHGLRADYEPAIAYTRRWLELDPLSERAHQQLMDLYAQSGRRTAALRQYRACLRVLEQELGVPPSTETTALYERIRSERTRPAASQAEASPPAQPDRPLPAFLKDEAAPPRVERPVFVARKQELVRLDGYLEQALAGQGQVVFVTGGPGRGKTTLIQEFARRATGKRANLLIPSGTCNAYSGAGDPYHPFRQVLAMLTGEVEGRWGAGVISTEHAQRLWAILPLAVQTLFHHDPHLIDVFLPGRAILSRAAATAPEGAVWLERLREWVERARGESTGLNPQYLFEQYTNALCDLAVEHPIVLLLDDLQWVDSPSASLLFHLGRRLAEQGGRVLVIGAYRPEDVALGRDEKQHPLEPVIGEFKRRFGDVELDLSQADRRVGRGFVDALLDSEPNRLGEDFRDKLHTWTGGHPLFTIELLRTLKERGDLTQDDGAWIEMPTLDWAALPARVEAVIEARLSRLDEDLRDILRVASVEGEAFTAQMLSQVQGLPERDVWRALSRELGERHRLVREAGEVRVTETGRFLSRCEFAHAMFQAFLYSSLSSGERRLLHGEVAAALERLYGQGNDEIAVALAHHYRAAGQRGKATEYALRAGELARRGYTHGEAIQYFQQALDLLDEPSQPGHFEEREEEEWRAAALKGLGQVYLGMGEAAAAEVYFRKAVELAREIELSPKEQVRLHWWLVETLFWLGRGDEARRVAEAGSAILERHPAMADSVEAALMNQGSLIGAVSTEKFEELLRRNARFARRLPYTEELRSAYVWIINWYGVYEPDLDKATDWFHTLEEMARSRHDLRTLGDAHFSWADAVLQPRGDLSGSLLHFRQALDYSRSIGDANQEARTLNALALVALVAGDAHAAEESALRAARTVRPEWSHASSSGHFVAGFIAAVQGDWEGATNSLRGAIRFFQDAGLRDPAVWTTVVLSNVYLAQGKRDEAITLCKEAMVMMERSRAWFHSYARPMALCALESAHNDPEVFHAYCRKFRDDNPESCAAVSANWYLESASVRPVRDPPLRHDAFESSLAAYWTWHDPFGDCGYGVEDGLEIRAASGRGLGYGRGIGYGGMYGGMNRSAPRLLMPIPPDPRALEGTADGETQYFAAQAVCRPVSEPDAVNRPSIGGLLLWRDEENWLRLTIGEFGAYDIVFTGCKANQLEFVGRGSLCFAPRSDQSDDQDRQAARSEQVLLRLERAGKQITALCSADANAWHTVGSWSIPCDGPWQVGLHAAAMIDQWMGPGVYPGGTSIRFESFTLWKLDG